ncbi:hypothetical protein E0H75_01255 [Kribbella capetownensis]|uniref:Lipopolysaccharide assembly protein A domain-containing protein n=1 Tax=Kribbella capetownensis TaxID=1572659 RepID=A0A4R0JXZ1_9ACTN|nr:hypothetical protein [Kribbella capetownensis]TCC52433.1 hypothetical protein E0H75_01255 [Kribbella capetownensis]
MAVLGIVLIVLAVLFGLGVSVTSTASTTMEVFGIDFGVSVPTVFLIGALTGVALALGLWLTKKGLARGYRRRKEMRELREQAASTEPAATTTSDTAPEVTAAPEHTEADSTEPDGTVPDRAVPEREPVAEERLATERHVAEDPTDTKQPH